MKEVVLALLQRLFGFERYLYLFARFNIATLRFDRRERDFLVFLQSLPGEGTVLDIGANIGIMTAHLARHVRNGEVVAFEPMPENHRVLRRIVDRLRLRNVRIEACALGDAEGTVEMVMPVERGALRHGLSHVVHASITERNEGRRLTASLRRLDDFAFLPPATRITGIKMDVENYEAFVLEGAVETLRTHRPLLYIELWANENRTRCLERLAQLGYRTFVCERGALVSYDPARHPQQNFIFRA